MQSIFPEVIFLRNFNFHNSPDILVTNLKPDLVIVNKTNKFVTLLELSVPFETNIENTHDRKVKRYQNLINDIEQSGYTVYYYLLEIGSQGFIDADNVKRLKSITCKYTKDVKLADIKNNCSKISLIGSYIIYHSKFEESWIEPKLIKI